MANSSTNLAQALGIAPTTGANTPITQVAPPAPKPAIAPPIASSDQIADDADFARLNIYEIIAAGTKAIDLAMSISEESLHPRSLEVLGQLLKAQSENIDRLLKVHKDKKEINDNSIPAVPASTTNIDQAIIFNGTSDDLIRMVRKAQKDDVPVIDVEIDDGD
jgi:hypothetical protein